MVLFSMLFFTACHVHVGVRLLRLAVLSVVSPMITAAVLGENLFFFFVFKLASV